MFWLSAKLIDLSNPTTYKHFRISLITVFAKTNFMSMSSEAVRTKGEVGWTAIARI
jgi:hypothetical protein